MTLRTYGRSTNGMESCRVLMEKAIPSAVAMWSANSRCRWMETDRGDKGNLKASTVRKGSCTAISYCSIFNESTTSTCLSRIIRTCGSLRPPFNQLSSRGLRRQHYFILQQETVKEAFVLCFTSHLRPNANPSNRSKSRDESIASSFFRFY